MLLAGASWDGRDHDDEAGKHRSRLPTVKEPSRVFVWRRMWLVSIDEL